MSRVFRSRTARQVLAPIGFCVLLTYSSAFFAQLCGGMHDLGVIGMVGERRLFVFSADGSVVVGTRYEAGYHTLRVTASGVVQDLGQPPYYNDGYGISADGNAVVGGMVVNIDGLGYTRAFRWTPSTGVQNLGTFGGDFSEAVAVSADGNVAVGIARQGGFGGPYRAFRWTPAGGMQDLGTLNPPWGGSSAAAVSADGNVVVGTSAGADGRGRVFRWTPGGGMQDLGNLGGRTIYGVNAISADGSSIIGTYSLDGATRAFRWTTATGMQDLGTLPGGGHTEPYALSADGNVVVGAASTETGYQHAFRWTPTDGIQDLAPLGNYYSLAYAVSADGSVIVGDAGHAFRWTVTEGAQDLGTMGALNSVALDVSADGRVVAGTTSNGRTFRWVHPYSCCPADFDQDGFITGLDYDLYVQAFENGDMSADFDYDGFVTGLDFDLYVQAFEAGC